MGIWLKNLNQVEELKKITILKNRNSSQSYFYLSILYHMRNDLAFSFHAIIKHKNSFGQVSRFNFHSVAIIESFDLKNETTILKSTQKWHPSMQSLMKLLLNVT